MGAWASAAPAFPPAKRQHASSHASILAQQVMQRQMYRNFSAQGSPSAPWQG
jgi:hypothetical protein